MSQRNNRSVHQGHVEFHSRMSGGPDVRAQAEFESFDMRHWLGMLMPPNVFTDAHPALLSGGPLDASLFIPRGSTVRITKITRSTHLPREI